MDNSKAMSKDKEIIEDEPEPKTLSKKELAALRDAAIALLNIRDSPHESIQSFLKKPILSHYVEYLKGESSGAGQRRPASNPRG